MNARSRWIEEIATIDEATFSFSEFASSLPSQLSFSPPVSTSSAETKFS